MSFKETINRIRQKEYRVGVVGLGYVGLPLMWTFHQKGMPVIGYDIDESKVTNLKEGIPYINYQELGDWSKCIVDTRNAMKNYNSSKENHIFKA